MSDERLEHAENRAERHLDRAAEHAENVIERETAKAERAESSAAHKLVKDAVKNFDQDARLAEREAKKLR